LLDGGCRVSDVVVMAAPRAGRMVTACNQMAVIRDWCGAASGSGGRAAEEVQREPTRGRPRRARRGPEIPTRLRSVTARSLKDRRRRLR
jgi:hypothetical protein